MAEREVLLRILDLARWAPSGDNTQPWRFQIIAGDHIAVHGNDTRGWCLYDFDGHASHMAHGALLETLRIAASTQGLRAAWTLRADTPAHAPVFDVRLADDAALQPDALAPFIETRSVQRRPLRTTPLTDAQRAALHAAVGPGYAVRLFDTPAARRSVAGLLWDSARIRLICPEAYEVHREIIEWNTRYSEDRIPERAVGVDPMTARLMRWVMGSWTRVRFFNRYLLGTVPPRIQLDLLPALRCAAHLLVSAEQAPRTLEDYVRAGVAMQRLWLTAEALDLRLQPQMTPLIFRWYATHRPAMSADAGVNEAVQGIGRAVDTVLGAGEQGVFFCRVGSGERPSARSVRRPLHALMLD
ncbi:molybdopterin biosynthesis protein MoeY [Pseudothauera nasutitermitis]|uniref:Molybdopterin biosynthesis protein MoeY n=1 Tax=Pseudothauera nasutitermitis TaxID=2565930 RepID=A0A4S4AZB9_9RHOO|nr:nitroreductase family protein [Pseudothauera nasutitermitis]THF65501.1 molybdopterin biosynthesis protein MoeY [Pseudothauera nasutitermitis]